MKELEKHIPEQTEVHAVKPASREKVIVSLKPKPGQRIWELDLATRLITEAKFRDEKVQVIPQRNIVTNQPQGACAKTVRDVDMKEGHLYCAALNHKSADRKFFKMLGLKYPKKKN